MNRYRRAKKSFLQGIGKFALIPILVGLAAGAFFYFKDTSGPEVVLTPGAGAVAGKRILQLSLKDAGAGLKSLSISVSQGDKTFELLSRSYAPDLNSGVEDFTLASVGLEDGPIELRVLVTDASVFRFGAGNTTERTYSLSYDDTAPIISVQSTAHNLNQGGAGCVVFSLSEEAERAGVTVGERFFPAYRQQSGKYAALFAFPYDIKPSEFIPKIVAVDRAGNERHAGFYFHTNARNFPSDRINISDRFLNSKMPQFENLYPEAGTPIELFLKVNKDLRDKNRASLVGHGLNTASTPLWEGGFLPQPRSATRSAFGDRRTYYYRGKEIDRQTHLGLDFASIRQAPVVAANAGKIVYADFLGIYGLCVIIDHGMGLQSLYSHLSQINVQEGDGMEKGQVVGRSGTTGMAGGDHLHFAMLVSGLPVNPVEWLDKSWVENNISSKLR